MGKVSRTAAHSSCLKLFGFSADTSTVPKVVLEYPNGRRHEVELDDEQRLEVGDSFDLHGRRWRVMSVASRRRAGTPRYLDTSAIVCRPITASPLRNAQASDTTAR